MKQYILVRTDKKFPIGKMLVHAGHNCVAATLPSGGNTRIRHSIFAEWIGGGMKKVAVKAGSDLDVKMFIEQAEREGIPASYIKDHNTGIRFCAAIGPVTDEESYHLGLADLGLYKG